MRGFWYTIEATIAISFMLVFLFIASNDPLFLPEEDDLTTRAFNILHGLAREGKLHHFAVADNHTGLNDEIKIFDRNHTIEICNPSGSCVGISPSAKNVWVGSYFIAGTSTYTPKEVKLYLF